MRAPIFLALLLAAGCGSSSSTTDGGGGDDGGGSTDGGGGADGALPTTKYVGTVTLTQADAQLAGGQAYKSFSVGASFLQPSGSGGGGSANVTTDGPCTITTAGDAGAPVDAGPLTLLSAGTLSVEGGLVPVSVMPNAQNQYVHTMNSTVLWNGGEMLGVKATGAAMGAPAFDLAVPAPGKATITAPAIAGLGQPTMVPRSANLSLAWTGGTGTLRAFFFVTGGSVFASCTFPASAGSGTVPASALGKLPAGGGTLYFDTSTTAQKVVGEWGLYAYASHQAVTPMQTTASGTALFQ
jgi:hypothetical protein